MLTNALQTIFLREKCYFFFNYYHKLQIHMECDSFDLGTNCTPPAIEDFPADLFTRQQRQSGAIIFHITISLYLFLALAIVCDKYFVPAVERISQGKCINHNNYLIEENINWK